MVASLNLNLIIPFKDNKGESLRLYKLEINRFREELSHRVEVIKDEMTSLFGDDFELTIAARSDGTAKKYYWRFKSSKRDRKYNRLYAEPVIAYISNIDRDRRLRLKEIEEELVDINANFKLMKGMLDAIEQSNNEKEELNKMLI